jgi:hypothetical protein
MSIVVELSLLVVIPAWPSILESSPLLATDLLIPATALANLLPLWLSLV